MLPHDGGLFNQNAVAVGRLEAVIRARNNWIRDKQEMDSKRNDSERKLKEMDY